MDQNVSFSGFKTLIFKQRMDGWVNEWMNEFFKWVHAGMLFAVTLFPVPFIVTCWTLNRLNETEVEVLVISWNFTKTTNKHHAFNHLKKNKVIKNKNSESNWIMLVAFILWITQILRNHSPAFQRYSIQQMQALLPWKYYEMDLLFRPFTWVAGIQLLVTSFLSPIISGLH